MIIFDDWTISARGAPIARQYDNLSRCLIVTGDIPDGWEWAMLVAYKDNLNILALEPMEGGIGVALTDDMIPYDGYYRLQLRGTRGEEIRHSNIVRTFIPQSLSGNAQWPTIPSEFTQLEERVQQAADQAKQSAATADQSREQAETATGQANQSATQAGQAAAQAGTAAGQAAQAANQAQQSAQQAGQSAQAAQEAREAIENLGVSAESLPAGSPAAVTKTEQAGAVNLKFGIPAGTPGKDGQDGQTPALAIGTVITLEPGSDATAEITGQTQNLTLNLGIPQGHPGQDAPQIDDEAVTGTNPWSSKRILDTLCPAFEVEGNPVTCTPVEGYPLGVQVSWEPTQEGEGDPSPDNVRPISGRESVSVTRCADNIFHKLNLRLGKMIYYGGRVGAIRFIDDSKRAVFQIKCLPNRTYSFYNPQYQKYWLNRIALCNSDGTMGYQNFVLYTDPRLNYESYTFTLQNHPATDLLIQFEKVDKSEFTQNDVDALTTMLIFGTTPPTAYEPYQGADYTLNLPETIYGGTLDAVTGVGSEEWKLVEFDGTETWSKYAGATEDGMIVFVIVIPDAALGYQTSICNQFKNVSGAWNRDIPWAYSDYTTVPNKYFCVQTSKFPDVDSWKSYLAAQYAAGTPVQVCYKLDTPQPIQATGGQPIPALAGTNTIYGDIDSVTVSGRADPLATIQVMQEQIAALTQHIAEGGTV